MRSSIGHNDKAVSVHLGRLSERIRRVALISDLAEGVARSLLDDRDALLFPEDKEGSAVDDSGELMIRLPENRQQ